MGILTDGRSWLFVVASSLACAVGALIIYSDVLVRCVLPRYRDFCIATSHGFLSASLCLSAGVMLFSSVYTILPISKEYILQDGYSARSATAAQSGLFVSGIVAVRFLSVVSRYLGFHAHAHPESSSRLSQHSDAEFDSTKFERGLRRSMMEVSHVRNTPQMIGNIETGADVYQPLLPNRRSTAQAEGSGVRHTTFSAPGYVGRELRNEPEISSASFGFGCGQQQSPKTSVARGMCMRDGRSNVEVGIVQNDLDGTHGAEAESSGQDSFASIGLQTSIAVAVHKFPEGFIIFTSNSTNRELGLAVFLSLFVHNVVEGFIVSLSLYMTLRSRAKAVVWALLIGCLSQPFGATIAMMWMKVDEDPNKAVLGSMYAFTAGIMTSLSFSLYSKALLLSLHDTWCNSFVFLGMAILGCTNTLIAR